MPSSNVDPVQPEQNLTNEEIAELAAAMSSVQSSAGEGPRVRAYDFVHPEKLSKRNLRALEMVSSELSRSWTLTLSSTFKMLIHVETHPNQQARFGDYVESIQEPRFVFGLNMDALPGAVFIDMPGALALGLVDRMAGGKGEVRDVARNLTQIERNIMKRLIERLSNDLAAAWKPVLDLQFAFSKHYSSVSDIELDPQEPVLLVETVWAVGPTHSNVNVVMPIRCLYPALDILAPGRWLLSEEAAEAPSTSVSDLLRPVELPVTVELGRARISLQDALNMEPGDVIRLDKTVGEPLQAAIDGKVMFHAMPGLVRNRVSVQIVDRAQEQAPSDETTAGDEKYAGAA